MANRYVLEFSKTGYAKYTSHLDLIRLFKRAFRKSQISLKYSQGFNPHPKIGFAQPLSLGYSSSCELLEFETDKTYEAENIFNTLLPQMPQGIVLKWCKTIDSNIKSLAAAADNAEYMVTIPLDITVDELYNLAKGYMEQEQILAMKRQKKDKKMVSIDIKRMIRSFNASKVDQNICLTMLLDCGSMSNCSPELVIASFCQYGNIEIPRYMIDVERTALGFSNNLQF